MRLSAGVCALAIYGSATSAQSPDTKVPAAARPTRNQAGTSAQKSDSLRLSRREAIAEALVRNAQLTIAREQTAQARARRQTAIAVPDPVFEAGFDAETAPFSFGGAGSRPVSLGLTIPFPDKFRLRNSIVAAGSRSSISSRR